MDRQCSQRWSSALAQDVSVVSLQWFRFLQGERDWHTTDALHRTTSALQTADQSGIQKLDSATYPHLCPHPEQPHTVHPLAKVRQVEQALRVAYIGPDLEGVGSARRLAPLFRRRSAGDRLEAAETLAYRLFEQYPLLDTLKATQSTFQALSEYVSGQPATRLGLLPNFREDVFVAFKPLCADTQRRLTENLLEKKKATDDRFSQTGRISLDFGQLKVHPMRLALLPSFGSFLLILGAAPVSARLSVQQLLKVYRLSRIRVGESPTELVQSTAELLRVIHSGGTELPLTQIHNRAFRRRSRGHRGLRAAFSWVCGGRASAPATLTPRDPVGSISPTGHGVRVREEDEACLPSLEPKVTAPLADEGLMSKHGSTHRLRDIEAVPSDSDSSVTEISPPRHGLSLSHPRRSLSLLRRSVSNAGVPGGLRVFQKPSGLTVVNPSLLSFVEEATCPEARLLNLYMEGVDLPLVIVATDGYQASRLLQGMSLSHYFLLRQHLPIEVGETLMDSFPRG